MSGIAGRVHFGREESDATLVERMILAMGHRRRDGDAFVNGGGATFGCAFTKVEQRESASDHVASCLKTGRVAVVDGYLQNHDDIAARCGLHDSGLHKSSSIAQLSLAAYNKWGAESVDMLRGDFALVIWDPVAKAMFAARDAFGARPLFFARDAEGVLFASEVQALANCGAMDYKPNRAALADFLVHSAHRAFEDTFVEGVKRVRAGHFVLLSERSADQHRYWPKPDIPKRSTSGAQPESAVAFREELVASVSRCIQSAAGPIAIELSGGFDSSAVALSAAQILREQPRADVTFLLSLLYPGLACDETIYSEAVAARTQFEHVKVLAPTLSPAAEGLYEGILASRSPVGDPTWLRTRAWGSAVRKRGAFLVLTGLGGDDLTWDPDYVQAHVFDGRYCLAITEVLCSHQLPRLREKLSALRAIAKQSTKRAFQRFNAPRTGFGDNLMRLESWIRRDELAMDESAFPQEPTADQLALSCGDRRHAELYSWVTSPGFLGALESIELNASRQGVVLRHPFLDRELADHVFAINAARRTGYPWRLKSLLQQAFYLEWPKPLVVRQGKATFDEYIGAAFGDMSKRVRDALPGGLRLSQSVFDPEHVDRARAELARNLDSTSPPGLFGEGRVAWLPASVELWLRSFDTHSKL